MEEMPSPPDAVNKEDRRSLKAQREQGTSDASDSFGFGRGGTGRFQARSEV